MSVRLFVLTLQQSTRTHFVDAEINKSLLTDLLSSGTFRYLFCWNTLLVASVIEWINKPTSFTAAVELSSLHSIGELSPQWSTVFPHTALELENVNSIQQYPSGCSLDNACFSISRLPLTLSPRNLSYLPTSSQQCVLRERMSARLIVNLTAIQMQAAQRSIVKLRKIVAGGLYPRRPLVASAPVLD